MSQARSVIGTSTRITGSISGTGELSIEGAVEGSVDVEGDVDIGSTARISAPVSGRAVRVEGAVRGPIRGASVVLEPGARVVGDLDAPSVGIRPGGLLKGYVSTDGSSAPAPARRATAATSRSAPAKAVRETSEPATAAAENGAARARKAPPAPKVPTLETRTSARTKTSKARARVEATEVPTAKKRAKRKAPPAPVVPALKKGAKGSVRRKGRSS